MRWIWGPVLMAGAGFSVGVWLLSADARRLGLMKRSKAPRARRGSKPKSGSIRPSHLVLLAASLTLGQKVFLAALGVLTAAYLRTVLSERRRKKEMIAEWPLFIESMSVASLSGMETGQAFREATRLVHGPLRTELDGVVVRMSSGMPLSRALQSMDEQALPDARRFRVSLVRTEILGTPVADTLRDLSREGYEELKRRMEERFNALPILLSVITVFFLLPPILAVSIAPNILAFLQSNW